MDFARNSKYAVFLAIFLLCFWSFPSRINVTESIAETVLIGEKTDESTSGNESHAEKEKSREKKRSLLILSMSTYLP